VPTDAEWDTLSAYLGGNDVSGRKLKESGTAHWNSPNAGATNESGFSALPGGFRDLDGGFYNVGGSGNWWSATEADASSADGRSIYYNDNHLNRNGSKSCGYSVRLVRD
jgi:uncharacterized protein (TIGR02145 family)